MLGPGEVSDRVPVGVAAAPCYVPEERLPARECHLGEVPLGVAPGELVAHDVCEGPTVKGCRPESVVVAEARADLVQLERAGQQLGGQPRGQALPQRCDEGMSDEFFVTASASALQCVLPEAASPPAITRERGGPAHAGEGPDVQGIVGLQRGGAQGLAEHRQ